METHYTYRVEWSTDRMEYTARCVEFSGLHASGNTAQEALAAIEAAVMEDIRATEEVFGVRPPKPLTEVDFSGRILVRTSRSLHARLTIEAAEQGVSLNQWVVQKLADRPPSSDW